MTPPPPAPPPSPAQAPRPEPSEERVETVRRAAERWKAQLIDTGGRNRLLYYRPFKGSTLDLSRESGGVDEQVLRRLLSGRVVELRALLPDPDTYSDMVKRTRNIFRKAKEHLEERGIDTLFLGAAQATWESDGPTPAAPVVLIPLGITPVGASQNDFKMEVAGEPLLNPVLVHHLQLEFGADLREVEQPAVESLDLQAVSDLASRVAAASSRVPGFEIDPDKVVLANFSYATMPMVVDLERSVEALASNDIVASLAGDEEALITMRERVSDVDHRLPDHTPPSDEFLVRDADASQNWAINSALRAESIVIEGPPGTGKSQTIANLISTLVARKKRVLFVAEKRAAIEAVIKRLELVGLEDLVLDLHGGVKNKRQLAQLLGESLTKVGSVPEPHVGDVHRNLVTRREALNVHAQAMHQKRVPWGLSVYELQALISAADDAHRLSIRLPDAVVNRLTPDVRRDVREAIGEWVDLGGCRLRPETTPWASSKIRTVEDARAAYDAAEGVAHKSLPEARRRLSGLMGSAGMGMPVSVDDWSQRLHLMAEVSETLEVADESLFALDLPELRSALTPAARSAFVRVWAHVADTSYRAAKRTIRGELKDSHLKPQAIVSLVERAVAQSEMWSAAAVDGGKPRLVDGSGAAGDALKALNQDLAALGAYLVMENAGTTPESELQAVADRLVKDQAWAFRLPRIRELEEEIREAGFGEFLDELMDRQPTAQFASDAFEYVVSRNVYNSVVAHDASLANFDGTLHSRRAAEYRELDEEHRESTAARVMRAAAELAVATRDGHPEENRVILSQAGRKRGHLPLRQLLMQAPNVMTALRPCWTMSPLLVAEVIPADRTLFDVVIFDEASQVPPAHAVGALGRADQAVVAGDRRQLPPTAFFLSSDAGSEDEEEDQLVDGALTSPDFDSIMDVLLAVPLRPHMLTWHYRSRDERLIAFSNSHIYGRALTTFPGVAGSECLRHDLVPFRPRPGMSTRSNDDEVQRVVELVIDHARNRPTESLGVIAMGIHHAQNIEEALRLRLHSEGDELLDAFFDESTSEAFFVKNLERVQGDERDAIILSVGYGKQEDGRLPYRFGPLLQEGGERRLNVAVTRARTRMTLVSSFSAHDMDPARSSAKGVELLRQYLAYASSGGDNLDEGTVTGEPLNAFELDVFTRLTDAGIPLIPQFGVGKFRIDFAASHPDYPGRMVLAIETDGATYHSSATARDRDRLRQQVLEDLGWTFHRIWSTEWFRNPEAETTRALEAWRRAIQQSQATRGGTRTRSTEGTTALAQTQSQRGPRPSVPRGRPIAEYTHQQLVAMVNWVRSDTLLRTEEEIIEELMRELGFSRRGTRIVGALTRAIRTAG